MNNGRIGSTTAALISVLAAFLLFSMDAQAAADNAGVLNEIVLKTRQLTQGIGTNIVGYATWLFWALATINMVMTFGVLALRKADIGDFFAEFVKFTITLGFFWWLLSNAITGMNIAGTIIESMRDMAALASGLGRDMNPSSIVDYGFKIFETVGNSDLGLAERLLAYFVAAGIVLVFASVGVNMVIALVESWFLLYGGVFILGFGGGRWTTDLAINYYRQVLGAGFKLFGMGVIIGLGKAYVDSFVASFSEEMDIQELLVMMVVAFVFWKLADRIPALMAGLVSGGSGGFGGLPGGGGGGVSAAGVAGAAVAAVGGVAAIAAAAAQAMNGQGAAAMNGGASALMNAMKAGHNALSTDSFTAGLDAFRTPYTDSPSPTEKEPDNTPSPYAQAAGYDRPDNGSSWPQFDGNSLSGANDNEATEADPNDEVAAFRDRGNQQTA
jgi:type IV secretion system protein VirB6/type IV secretion system protein TrbL